MSTSTAKPIVTIELLDGDEARAIAAAVEEDNPGTTVDYLLGIVAISAPSPMVVNRATVEMHLGGRFYNLRHIQEIVADFYGNLVESSEDQWILEWRH